METMNISGNKAASEGRMKHVAEELFEKGRSLLIDMVLHMAAASISTL
jgi:hypothetical protein